MLNGFPFLNQSLSPTQSLTFKFMGTVGNLNIKAAAVIDSCLLIFQSSRCCCITDKVFGCATGKKTAACQGRGGSAALDDTCSLQLGVEMEKQEE